MFIYNIRPPLRCARALGYLIPGNPQRERVVEQHEGWIAAAAGEEASRSIKQQAKPPRPPTPFQSSGSVIFSKAGFRFNFFRGYSKKSTAFRSTDSTQSHDHNTAA
jgi:hypothetical protein